MLSEITARSIGRDGGVRCGRVDKLRVGALAHQALEACARHWHGGARARRARAAHSRCQVASVIPVRLSAPLGLYAVQGGGERSGTAPGKRLERNLAQQ
eukprot:124238-Prymnesium_polylepis.1